MAEKCFLTIGYGKSNIKDFISFLIKYRVNCLVDVRSSPISNYNHEYDEANLKDTLAKFNISYEWLGNKIGGRPNDPELFINNVISYEKLVKTKTFKEGIEKLEFLIEKKNVCIMCSEWNPMDCHRFMAISKVMYENGYRIWHIKANGSYIKHEQLEAELINTYFGENYQITIFDCNPINEREESYKKHNAVKGYPRK